jgi:predicted house-cleaning noncanonical NTP pyrophosphatase (MazG superfamily)
MSSPFNWLLGIGNTTTTTNLSNTTLNQNTTQIPPSTSTPTANNLSLYRNLNQLIDEGQRSSIKTKRELLNNLDQLSTLAFLNSSTGINVQRIQDQFEQIDKTLQTTTVIKSKDETFEQQLDGKLTNNLNDYLKHEREKTLLSMLRMIEDKVNKKRSHFFSNNFCIFRPMMK